LDGDEEGGFEHRFERIVLGLSVGEKLTNVLKLNFGDAYVVL